MRIIINADDLGLSQAVNDACFELMSAGKITSATLLANGAGTEDAIRRSRAFPGCSFGVHLYLDGFAPMTTPSEFHDLLDAKGCFDADKVRQIKPNPDLKQAVFLEWREQIRRVQSLGAAISHIDSHHHMHTRPWLFGTLKKVQQEFCIRKIRISMNAYPPEHRPSSLKLCQKLAFNFALRHYHKTTATKWFTNFEWFLALKALGHWRNSDRVEIMVHPGHPKFARETALLQSAWRDEFEFPVQFINYNDL